VIGVLPAIVFVAANGEDDTPSLTPTNFVQNGSFENRKNTWIDKTCNYMSLSAGSTAIPGWTVTTSTTNEIVWAMTPTCDSHTAATGTFFLDLTGFGGDSPFGGVQQTMHHLTVGHHYALSLDVEINGLLPLVTVGHMPISLTAGKPFKKGSDTWTPERGTFMAQSANELLTIENQQSGQQIDFIDNVIVKAE
jgi:hypothetical protein